MNHVSCPSLSSSGPRLWGETALKAGFEEVELLDAVDYGGLNGAPAGRFLDVSGWVGVLVGIELDYVFGGSWGLFPQSVPR